MSVQINLNQTKSKRGVGGRSQTGQHNAELPNRVLCDQSDTSTLLSAWHRNRLDLTPPTQESKHQRSANRKHLSSRLTWTQTRPLCKEHQHHVTWDMLLWSPPVSKQNRCTVEGLILNFRKAHIWLGLSSYGVFSSFCENKDYLSYRNCAVRSLIPSPWALWWAWRGGMNGSRWMGVCLSMWVCFLV